MRRALGARSVEVTASSVADLLDALVEIGGPELAARLFDTPHAAPRSPHPDLRVLVNGRNVHFLEGLETRLCDADVVTLHPAGARGYPGG